MDFSPPTVPATVAVARIWAHQAFDELWEGKGNAERSRCYRQLAKALEIGPNDCHMERFDIRTCMKVIEICKAWKAA